MSQCPSSIVGIEIGNEPDKFGSWAVQTADYERFADSILATPGALLVGPGCISINAASYSAPFADTIAAKYGSKLTLLAQHSYVAASSSSECSLANLQITTTKLTDIFDTIQAAAAKNNLPGWRMDENNTCSGHGRQGLSDTLISGLLGDRLTCSRLPSVAAAASISRATRMEWMERFFSTMSRSRRAVASW